MTRQIPTHGRAREPEQRQQPARAAKAVPGLLLGLHVSPDKNTLCVLLKNSASADIKSLDLTIRLPPAWKQGVVRKELGSVKAGAVQRVEFPLGDKQAGSDDPADLYFVAQCDVRDAAGAARIYLSTSSAPRREAVAQDSARLQLQAREPPCSASRGADRREEAAGWSVCTRWPAPGTVMKRAAGNQPRISSSS